MPACRRYHPPLRPAFGKSWKLIVSRWSCSLYTSVSHGRICWLVIKIQVHKFALHAVYESLWFQLFFLTFCHMPWGSNLISNYLFCQWSWLLVQRRGSVGSNQKLWNINKRGKISLRPAANDVINVLNNYYIVIVTYSTVVIIYIWSFSF